MKNYCLVSACLLGKRCRYDGKDNLSEKLNDFLEKNNLETLEICPEVMGGLSVPRTPCEIVDGKVIDINGVDKTKEYAKGAEIALQLAKRYDCKIAILKSKSPSCGFGKIYDGTHTRTLVDGNGICADLLIQNGVKVISSDEL